MVGALIPSTPVDHQHIALKAVPGCRAAARHAVLPRPRQPRLRQERARRHGLRRVRDRSGVALGGRRPLGPRRALAAARLRALRPAHGRGDPPLPVPRRRRGDPARLPPGRDDPRCQPAPRPAAGRPRVLGRGRACRSTGSAAVAGSAGRWPAGSRPATRASTSVRTARGGSARSTATRCSRPGSRARRTPTTTGLRYPYDADVAGRPKRLSPLHGRLQETGAVFGTKAGWERADHHEPGRPWRRAGRDQARLGLDASRRGSTRVCDEARAVRERAGIIDLSSFGKIAVDGPGALGLLQRVAANDVDRPVGSVVYTPFLDDARRVRRGRDGHAAGRRPVPGRDRGRVRGVGPRLASSRTRTTTPSRLRDVSGEIATIGLWGPRARDILAAATTGRRRRRGPARSGGRRPSGSAGATVLASRISYAGELGWELSADAELGGRGLGRPAGGRSRPSGSSRSATAPSTPSGWRRAIATSAPT